MSETHPQIAPPKQRRAPLLIGIAALVVLVLVAGFLWMRGGDETGSAGEANEKVVLGTVGASDPYWQVLVDEAAEQGIDLEVKDFADYTQPNPALSEGELDINQFQHIVYLAEYNVANDDDVVPLGSTAIYPLGLYSTKVDAVEDIEDGDTVVVPDDDSNQARALLILQSAGLITLEDGGSIYSTLADIDQDASRVEVKAIKADLTPTSLPDVAAAVVNNDFVEKAGLEFEDALATDDAEDPKALPYVNVFAVRAEDQEDPTLRKLVEIYQDTQPVLDGVQDVSGGTAQLVKVPQEDLQAALDEVEADTAAQQ
ncbi:MetQ/NlpA family ABC transporter substrate-binding protein [Microbacterium sp. ARD31]|uniref:MetQ/NlpA family ABC transporter substrate-binding protein n=1 Tax=Microbacterium sp. ARD31 TaxID=2962576 RepID=UPI002881ADA6|nr:MetQ/NlpA family ABC transporter substrate-binding protein [Microbacterium sp. ARD31]MDT0182752.1 MetQ/NlpA family ABC transporter substrate-binding protein [Microbacterium sp. ARD31]